jgi:hypothetical protein
MRTTLTIDPDVEVQLKRKMAKERVSLKQAVNDTLRAGLSQRPAKLPKFVVKPKAMGIMPGIDYNKINQLIDDMEVEEYLKKHPR